VGRCSPQNALQRSLSISRYARGSPIVISGPFYSLLSLQYTLSDSWQPHFMWLCHSLKVSPTYGRRTRTFLFFSRRSRQSPT
jgi:hypothetical protein